MFQNYKNSARLLLLLYLTAGLAGASFGQEKPPKQPKTKELPSKPGPHQPGFFNRDAFTTERLMMVDPNVAVKLCVAEGDLRINGWRRNEVRVFVKRGRKFVMKAQEKSPESGKVNWLWISNASTQPGLSSDCLAGESIEIDAPLGTSIDLKGHQVNGSIDSLRKVNVDIVAGTIALRNVSGGISARTGRGDLMVQSSAGSISLVNTTGNIVIAEVTPGQIGDILKAKTNSGAITLQTIEHRQIEASSISGAILFDGKFLSGGIYNFRSSHGSIRLAIPAVSSCTFRATYGFGDFRYDIPLTVLTHDKTPRAQTVVAKAGKGDASVSLTTTSGSIEIRRN